ncbi:MAG: GT4 family glycosyltransferase PelF, partial [Pandoraea sp.]|nr:GT4 family glycosyltransferase PelF [Pandoraea sp.]
MRTNERRADSADIALLLEGTFPYVRGGVSSWVDQMIRAFPDLTFAVVFIGSRREDYGDMVYPLYDNIVHFEAHYLYEFEAPAPMRAAEGDAQAFEKMEKMHDMLRRRDD